MKRKDYIRAAIEALEKQRKKYRSEYDKAEASEDNARKTKAWFAAEIEKLDAQIASIEETLPKEKVAV